jgi:hypothetical protein
VTVVASSVENHGDAGEDKHSSVSSSASAWWECDFCGRAFGTFEEASVHETRCDNKRKKETDFK